MFPCYYPLDSLLTEKHPPHSFTLLSDAALKGRSQGREERRRHSQ